MADMASGLMKLLDNLAPIGIAYYSTTGAMEDFIRRTEVLAEPRQVQLVQEVSSLFATLDHGGDIILIVPSDESSAVAFLDRNRDSVVAKCKPVLLILTQGGQGQQALAKAPALASIVRGAIFSVDTAITREAAETAFEARHGVSYNDWLARWRSGELEDTTDNNLTLSEALAIEGDP